MPYTLQEMAPEDNNPIVVTPPDYPCDFCTSQGGSGRCCRQTSDFFNSTQSELGGCSGDEGAVLTHSCV